MCPYTLELARESSHSPADCACVPQPRCMHALQLVGQENLTGYKGHLHAQGGEVNGVGMLAPTLLVVPLICTMASYIDHTPLTLRDNYFRMAKSISL